MYCISDYKQEMLYRHVVVVVHRYVPSQTHSLL